MGDICQICEEKYDKNKEYTRLFTFYGTKLNKHFEIIIAMHQSCIEIIEEEKSTILEFT